MPLTLTVSLLVVAVVAAVGVVGYLIDKSDESK
jgi:hypothetical protein